MKNISPKWNCLFNKQLLTQFVCASCIYLFVSIYLYGPYFRVFSRIEYLFVINSATGSIGCFLLSRRWTKTFTASILAGAIYAFGPFLLGFSAYHPFAGIPAAILPWLFIPAAILASQKRFRVLFAATSGILYALAFVTILLFFYLLSLPTIGPFFPMPPIQSNLANFTPIIFQLTGSGQDFIVSFYHLPLFAIIIAMAINFRPHKIALVILSAAAIALSFHEPILQTPPVIWLLLPIIYCSVLSASGAESIIKLNKSPKLRIVISIIFYTACFADILWGAKYTLEQIFGYGF